MANLTALGAGLAHEIKNPLSTLVLNAQLLREEILDLELPEDRGGSLTRRVDTLTRESNRLKEILEDFLRYAGRMVVDRTETDLRTLIDELADFVHPQCERAGVQMRVDLPKEPIAGNLDAGLLKQALLNLVVNALQAMGPPPALEEAARAPRSRELILKLEPADSTRWTRMHVIDTGPGIDPALVAEIFRPYVTSKRSGSGLGLPTARRIATEHGGTLEVHSTPGLGCDFVLWIPLDAPDAGK